MDLIRAADRRLPEPVRQRVRRMRSAVLRHIPSTSNARYWSRYNVTAHAAFASREESVEYLRWRNGQYLFYEDFLPFAELDGQRCLDFGCGPAHDVVALLEWSNASRVVGADISTRSIAEAEARVTLHDTSGRAELALLDEGQVRLPFEDGSFDLVVSSGVLHHIENVEDVLNELNRVLAPGGRMRLMVYNRDSVYVHLHVAWKLQLMEKIDRGRSLEDAFRRATDGETCPRSVFYTPEEWIALCGKAGLDARWLDAAVATSELDLLQRRWEAVADRRLAAEHREFLRALTFDSFGRPQYNGRTAGIDGLFEAVKRG